MRFGKKRSYCLIIKGIILVQQLAYRFTVNKGIISFSIIVIFSINVNFSISVNVSFRIFRLFIFFKRSSVLLIWGNIKDTRSFA